MPEYVLRNLDPQLWSQFTERAGVDGWTTRPLIEALMAGYASGEFSPQAPPPRDLPQYGWLRAHYKQAAHDSGFQAKDAAAQWALLTQHVLASAAGHMWKELRTVPEVQRPQVLDWLRRTSDLPTSKTLTLRATAYMDRGPGSHRRAFQYEVLGLPAGRQALIADFNGGWRILDIRGDKSGDWSNPHHTKEDALNEIADIIDNPR